MSGVRNADPSAHPTSLLSGGGEVGALARGNVQEGSGSGGLVGGREGGSEVDQQEQNGKRDILEVRQRRGGSGAVEREGGISVHIE